MTTLEDQVSGSLIKFGFIIKKYKQRQITDPANTIYSQVPVGSARLDFALLNSQIAIEADGLYWHSGIKKIYDSIRDRKLRSLGWKIIRIGEHINEPHLFYSILFLMDV